MAFFAVLQDRLLRCHHIWPTRDPLNPQQQVMLTRPHHIEGFWAVRHWCLNCWGRWGTFSWVLDSGSEIVKAMRLVCRQWMLLRHELSSTLLSALIFNGLFPRHTVKSQYALFKSAHLVTSQTVVKKWTSPLSSQFSFGPLLITFKGLHPAWQFVHPKSPLIEVLYQHQFYCFYQVP